MSCGHQCLAVCAASPISASSGILLCGVSVLTFRSGGGSGALGPFSHRCCAAIPSRVVSVRCHWKQSLHPGRGQCAKGWGSPAPASARPLRPRGRRGARRCPYGIQSWGGPPANNQTVRRRPQSRRAPLCPPSSLCLSCSSVSLTLALSLFLTRALSLCISLSPPLPSAVPLSRAAPSANVLRLPIDCEPSWNAKGGCTKEMMRPCLIDLHGGGTHFGAVGQAGCGFFEVSNGEEAGRVDDRPVVELHRGQIVVLLRTRC